VAVATTIKATSAATEKALPIIASLDQPLPKSTKATTGRQAPQ